MEPYKVKRDVLNEIMIENTTLSLFFNLLLLASFTLLELFASCFVQARYSFVLK